MTELSTARIETPTSAWNEGIQRVARAAAEFERAGPPGAKERMAVLLEFSRLVKRRRVDQALRLAEAPFGPAYVAAMQAANALENAITAFLGERRRTDEPQEAYFARVKPIFVDRDSILRVQRLNGVGLSP